ncbi:acetolactate decarboxylase [Parapedobacter koreensis]|uniref:Alpha-acetolactate decarboxylase n=1 Tax=Parapedobacter koreensis TaxID=332977 RepID=A0A1H7SLM8_9SPHI|nr:acetolactate decarboxylase [Parapedobacter koreensis]SEL73425.1 acetolactate decarboxylase [Parapedobacter koreensis]
MIKTYWWFLLGVFSVACSGEDTPDKRSDNLLYQYSTIDALLGGVFEGDLHMSDLGAQGDFGIGTFNAVDGELFMNEGELYRIRHDGKAYPVAPSETSPFAVATFFQRDTVFEFNAADGPISYEGLQDRLGRLLKANHIYAIRIIGDFAQVRTRAPAPAHRPYPTLLEHLNDHQHTFTLNEVKGTMVGFFVPHFLKNINVDGFHFHLLTADKQAGGHVFGFESRALKIELSRMRNITVELPGTSAFQHVNLTMDRNNDVRIVEQGK